MLIRPELTLMRYAAVSLLLVVSTFDRFCWSLTLPARGNVLEASTSTPSPRSSRLDQEVETLSNASLESLEDGSERKRRKCQVCPQTEREDFELDRREAAFAMLGSLWAIAGSALVPDAANAAYGADAKIELPNPIETMSQRVSGQCLVETLGNRECLVYLDPANKLYQGADNTVLLERIEQASEALATIPGLVSSKKWSQVIGVLTGPLGTLVLTMNQLGKLSENEAKALACAKKVKADIVAISVAADRKQGDAALKSHKDATESLVAFVKSL